MVEISTDTVRAWLVEHQGATVDEVCEGLGAHSPAARGRVLWCLRQLRDHGAITDRWFARTEPGEAPSSVATRHMRSARRLADVIKRLAALGHGELAEELATLGLQA